MRVLVLALTLTLGASPALAGEGTPRAPLPATAIYRANALGFTIAYSPRWTVDAHYTRDASPPVKGVSFTVPTAFVTGTNLGSDTRLSVEHVAGACSAARFLDAAEDQRNVTEDGRTFSVASEDDAGAGNRYEETVYALAKGKTCFAIHTFIHYSAIQNYDPGTVKAFDRGAVTSIFDVMRHSFAFTN
jgi:hypothetical protein